MASVLILSDRGKSIAVGSKLKSEGHIVKIWCPNDQALKGWKNPTKIRNPLHMLEQFDLVLGDGILGQVGMDIEKAGRRIFGWGAVTEKLILDKAYQAKVIDFLRVGTDAVEGIEIELTGFMSAQGFSPLVLLSLPSYYFMEKDKGVRTEGMGSLVVYLKEEAKLTKVLLPFEAFLLKAGYIGSFTLALGIKAGMVFIRSIDTSLHPQNILAGAELLKTSLFDFLFGVQEERVGSAWDGYGISVALSLPPWPYAVATPTTECLLPPYEAIKHASLGDPMVGLIGVITAKGADVREARRRVYRTVQNSVHSRGVQFREDVGIMQEKDLAILKEWGWLDE